MATRSGKRGDAAMRKALNGKPYAENPHVRFDDDKLHWRQRRGVGIVLIVSMLATKMAFAWVNSGNAGIFHVASYASENTDGSLASINAYAGSYVASKDDVWLDGFATVNGTWGAHTYILPLPENIAIPETLSYYRPKGSSELHIGTVRVLRHQAFAGFDQLLSVSIPSTIRIYGGAEFARCTSLHSVAIGCHNVSGSMFNGCTSLRHIDLPSGVVTNISNEAFEGSGLLDVVIPSSVRNIGTGAFRQCSNMTSVVIGKGVQSIGNQAFKYCQALKFVELPQNVDVGRNAFEGCTSMSSIVIPSGALLEYQAFRYCSGLKSIVVENAGEAAGSSAWETESFAFCGNLERITFKGNAPAIPGRSPFRAVPSTCTVYVHRGSTGWGVDIPGTWQGLRIEYIDEDDPTVPTYYDITYKPGFYGSGLQQTATKTKDVTLTLKDAIFTRTGYTQTGWSTNDGGAKAYDLGASYTANAALTLYPFWTANGYTVSLDRQSGSGGTYVLTATYGSPMPSITVPTRSGYAFDGYYTGTNGSGTQYYTASGMSARNWDRTSATTLYAKWTAATTPTSFTFGGDAVWLQQRDGSWKSGKIYDNERTYASMNVTGPGTISFRWKTSSESGYDKLHFYVNGSEPVAAISGEMDSWASVSYNVAVSGSVTLKWEYAKDVSAYVGSDCGWIKDVAWNSTTSEKTYIVRLHRNNSERDGSTAGRTYTIGKARALPKVQKDLKWAPRKGYDFLGWARTADATTAQYTDGESLKDLTKTADETVHLYAVWKAHHYIVRLHRNNSKNDGATTGRAFDYDQVRFLPTMAEIKWARSGYMFLGWSLAQSSTTVKYADGLNVFNLSANDGEELHLWGVWKKSEANAYLLRLHRNNSERDGATAGRQLKLNTNRKLPTVKELGWARSDATFKGWATTAGNAAAGKVAYKDGATVKNLVKTLGDTAHLYAVWQ